MNNMDKYLKEMSEYYRGQAKYHQKVANYALGGLILCCIVLIVLTILFVC